jgi:hypothetical protein
MSKLFKASPQSSDYKYKVTTRKKLRTVWKSNRISRAFASS